MELDESDKRQGLKFLVGKWEIDYLVNAWSNNLEHIPPTEFKSKDGKDLSQISYEFFEDYTVKLRNGATGVEVDSTWEQKSYGTFHFDSKNFFGEGIPKELLESMEKIENVEGSLVFGFGFLCVRMKKTAEGHITKPKDIGDLECTPEDLQKKEIVGRWKVYKSMACVGDDFGLFTLEQVKAEEEKKKVENQKKKEELLKKKETGSLTEDEQYELEDIEHKEKRGPEFLQVFGTVYEFTDDHKVLAYMPLPEGVPQEEIDKAVASGEIKLVDGMLFDGESKEWKYVKGDYWYNTGETRIIFDEPASPWDKITPDSEGHIDMKMFVLEKIK